MNTAIAAAVDAVMAGEGFRMTVGLRPLATSEWIEDLPDYDAQLREKRRVLDECDDVLGARPDTRASQAELLAMLRTHVLTRFPERYIAGEDSVAPRATGERVATSGSLDCPIDNAARLVPEDLCLMREDANGEYRLVAAALAFPTRWRLADKLGRPMMAIHAPVPGYRDTIGAATDRLMASLRVARPLWRHNWSIVDAPNLHQPERPPMGRVDNGRPLAERLWVRTERQTLRRLPESGDVLFTIRIRQVTVAELCERPGATRRLLNHLLSMPESLRNYKRIGDVETELFPWLEARAMD